LREAYRAGGELLRGLQAGEIDYLPAATVWHLDAARRVGVSRDARARMLDARQVIVATGALERPMPVPGWTLPGVMTVGAAQTLLKSQGLVPTGRVVLAGTGPLLWLFAAQCAALGHPPSLLLDTTERANWRQAWRHLPSFLASPYLAKGLTLLARVKRRIRVVSGVSRLAIAASDAGLSVAWPGGEAAADHVLLHQGVVPNLNLAQAAGCAVRWEESQACFVPVTDEWGESTVPGIAIAGDGAGIGGAEAAAIAGRIAALGALHRLAAIEAPARDSEAEPHRRARRRWQAGRLFLDTLYRPAPSFRVATPEAIVCRCEEVTGAELRHAATRGATGPNQAKTLLRCGMGPCQGRLCALTIVETLADAHGTTPAAIGPMRVRSPVKPISVAEIASIDSTEEELAAVERR
jgi:NADPH-dependent 2,4-dienoyl-CoA reductase/sulfur reductase-like enzyme